MHGVGVVPHQQFCVVFNWFSAAVRRPKVLKGQVEHGRNRRGWDLASSFLSPLFLPSQLTVFDILFHIIKTRTEGKEGKECDLVKF
jgi:hypothetical protein